MKTKLSLPQFIPPLSKGICMAFAAACVGLLSSPAVHAHGTLLNSRILQVRLAGPSGGAPAPWNESYYTWNQNSNNFPTYSTPGFSYADFIPDGKISSAGVNDGTGTGLDFSALDTPSDLWNQTPAAAGEKLTLQFLATAPHDPSYFEVYLTLQGFDVASSPMGWSNLEYLGRWSIDDPVNLVTMGTVTNPVTGSPSISYDWDVLIPGDRSGHHAIVVVWQRVDPAGEAFIATQDINVEAIPEPGGVALAVSMGAVLLLFRKRNSSRKSGTVS